MAKVCSSSGRDQQRAKYDVQEFDSLRRTCHSHVLNEPAAFTSRLTQWHMPKYLFGTLGPSHFERFLAMTIRHENDYVTGWYILHALWKADI
jgi:hypothetical protein